MSALAKVSPAALIPAATGALAQLQPVMVHTQKSVQELTATVMRTTDSYEKRCQQLEAENVALKAQIAADRIAAKARKKAQDNLNKTLLSTVAALQADITALKEETSYLRPAIKAMVVYGAAPFVDLDYPDKDKDIAVRKPILKDEIENYKEQLRILADTRGIGWARSSPLNQKLSLLNAEGARIAAFEARTKTKV